MCPRCEGLGEASEVDIDELVDREKSLAEGAIKIPGYSTDGWMVRGFTESGFVDADKKIKDYSEQELADFLYREPTKVKIQSINMTYEGLVPKITKSMLQKDRDSLQPHIRAFVDRAVKFTACPACGGTRLNEGARSSKIRGMSIADVAAMQISDLADGSTRSTIPRWHRSWWGCARPSRPSSTSVSAICRSIAPRARFGRRGAAREDDPPPGLRPHRHHLRLRRADQRACIPTTSSG